MNGARDRRLGASGADDQSDRQQSTQPIALSPASWVSSKAGRTLVA